MGEDGGEIGQNLGEEVRGRVVGGEWRKIERERGGKRMKELHKKDNIYIGT